jgi:hypothetical protein
MSTRTKLSTSLGKSVIHRLEMLCTNSIDYNRHKHVPLDPRRPFDARTARPRLRSFHIPAKVAYLRMYSSLGESHLLWKTIDFPKWSGFPQTRDSKPYFGTHPYLS